MKNLASLALICCAVVLSLATFEAHEIRNEAHGLRLEASGTRSALDSLTASARDIALAEREDNYLWLHATTTDQWTGVDGGSHSVTTERRQGQNVRDWLDEQNKLVAAKIASNPLAYTPKER